MPLDGSSPPLYDAVGGMRFFEVLVDAFYAGVALDPALLALYPEPGDLSGARHRLTLFLAQFWVGPTTYSDERGHPRLKMRHFPFRIGEAERDRWLHHMLNAIDEVVADAEVRDELRAYFVPAAEHLRNDSPLRFTPGA